MSPLNAGWDLGARLTTPQARQASYGMAYVLNVCAQFGVGTLDTKQDQDVNAIDTAIDFGAAAMRIQVKCTTADFTKRDPHISWPIEPTWVTKWRENLLPTFLILVKVPHDPRDWLDYDTDDETLHRAAAYWVQINNLPDPAPASLIIPRTNRFTPETVRDWNALLQGGFTQGGVADDDNGS